MRTFPVRVGSKGVRTAIPLAAMVVAGDMGGTNQTSPVLTAEAEVGVIADAPSFPTDCTATTNSMTVALHFEEWTDRLEKRFLELAKKDALSKASATETAELEQLEHQRNRLKSPMTFDELIWHARHEEATQKLLSAMQDYLSFCSGPSWTSAKRNR